MAGPASRLNSSTRWRLRPPRPFRGGNLLRRFLVSCGRPLERCCCRRRTRR
jgi:hypothetical protein